MTIYNFEDLVIWKLSRVLINNIYKEFANSHDYGFRDQIQRAAVSVMNNIAEGFEKNKYTSDNRMFLSYLNISYGSCGEVRSMLYLAEDLNYVSPEQAQELRNQCINLQIKIESFIKNMKSTKSST